MPPLAVMVLLIEVPREDEDAFNAWYDKEHLPEVCALPGIVSARRFRESAQRYITIYELEDPAALDSDAYRAWRATSRGTDEMTRRFRSFSRHVGVAIASYPPKP